MSETRKLPPKEKEGSSVRRHWLPIKSHEKPESKDPDAAIFQSSGCPRCSIDRPQELRDCRTIFRHCCAKKSRPHAKMPAHVSLQSPLTVVSVDAGKVRRDHVSERADGMGKRMELQRSGKIRILI